MSLDDQASDGINIPSVSHSREQYPSFSAGAKAAWAKNQGLGGIMLWDLSGDFVDSNPRSIVNAVQKNLTN